MKPWLIYVRVSTDDQAREGVSLDAQRAACEAMAKALGLPVSQVIVDAGYSAKSLDRPGMIELLRAVDQQSVSGVLIYKIDRLTRSLRDLLDLVDRFTSTGTAVHSVQDKLDTSSPNGRFFVSMLGAIAQWEREQIAERVTMGMRHRKAQGGFVGGRTPAGLLVRGDPGKRELLAHPEHGPIVAQVWPQIVTGKSLRQVADFLTSAGVPSGSGRWTPNGVQKIAKSERYIGILVTREAFDLALQALRGRMAPGRTDGRLAKTQTHAIGDWLLSGVGRCGTCGATLVGVSATSHTGRSYRYYRCTGRTRFGRLHCAATDLRAEPWEGAVIDVLVRAVGQDGQLAPRVVAYADQARSAAGDLQAKRQPLVMERDRAAVEVGRLVDLAATGSLAASAVTGPLAERQARLEALDRDLATLDGQIAAAAITADQADAIVDVVRRRIDTLAEAPPDEQVELIRTLVSEVILRRDTADKTTGEVDLSINLPRLAGSGFVYPSPLVEHSSRRTNSVRVCDRVDLSRRIA